MNLLDWIIAYFVIGAVFALLVVGVTIEQMRDDGGNIKIPKNGILSIAFYAVLFWLFWVPAVIIGLGMKLGEKVSD